FREAVCVIANSRYTRGLVEKLYEVPSTRTAIVPPGVDTEEFNPDVDGRRIRERFGLQDARIALTVSRLDACQRHKGQDTVIEALPEVLRHVPEARYLIVGRGDDEPRLRALAEQKGVSEQVILAGAASAGDLPAFYAASDVYVMPSRQLRRG